MKPKWDKPQLNILMNGASEEFTLLSCKESLSSPGSDYTSCTKNYTVWARSGGSGGIPYKTTSCVGGCA